MRTKGSRSRSLRPLGSTRLVSIPFDHKVPQVWIDSASRILTLSQNAISIGKAACTQCAASFNAICEGSQVESLIDKRAGGRGCRDTASSTKAASAFVTVGRRASHADYDCSSLAVAFSRGDSLIAGAAIKADRQTTSPPIVCSPR